MDKPGPPVEGLFDQMAGPKSSTPVTTSSPARRQVSIHQYIRMIMWIKSYFIFQLNFSSFNTIGQGSPVVNQTPAVKEGSFSLIVTIVIIKTHIALSI